MKPMPSRKELLQAMDNLATKKAVAAHFNVSIQTIERWCREHRLHFSRVKAKTRSHHPTYPIHPMLAAIALEQDHQELEAHTLADMAGVSVITIRRIRRGKGVSASTWYALARALGFEDVTARVVALQGPDEPDRFGPRLDSI